MRPDDGIVLNAAIHFYARTFKFEVTFWRIVTFVNFKNVTQLGRDENTFNIVETIFSSGENFKSQIDFGRREVNQLIKVSKTFQFAFIIPPVLIHSHIQIEEHLLV